jgi:ubiquitin carboxyl-terminal hydrolase L5
VEGERRRQWEEENVRRRTDYLPAIYQILAGLAAKGQLQPLVDSAVEAHKAKRQQQQQQQQGGQQGS